MPRDKDLKRLARERMEKTGESYTTARARLLAKRSLAGERLTESQLAELAGLSTAALLRSTGHDWGWWLDHLNSAQSKEKEHREITRYVGGDLRYLRLVDPIGGDRLRTYRRPAADRPEP